MSSVFFLLIILFFAFHPAAADLDARVASQPSLLEVRLVHVQVTHGGVTALGFNAGRKES